MKYLILLIYLSFGCNLKPFPYPQEVLNRRAFEACLPGNISNFETRENDGDTYKFVHCSDGSVHLIYRKLKND